MKPTTTWVFASPVRPQQGLSRIIHGLSGCAAGAHTRYFPAVQRCQPKRVLYSAGGDLSASCRFLWLLLVMIICPAVYAQSKSPEELATVEANVEPRGEPTAEDRRRTQALAQTCRTGGGKAPTMVVIKPGQFQMGSTDGSSDEQPVHVVTIPQPFAISRCEITVGQFRQFVEDAGYRTTAEKSGKGCYVWNAEKKQEEKLPEHNWNNPGFKQTDDHPVVCVSWDDAQAYVTWLSRRTGAAYRLPSEAEWEYAARAGTTAARYYQDNKHCDYANGIGSKEETFLSLYSMRVECGDGYVYTAPVGSFGENHYGLFDMLGNALEWTQDCWHDNYDNAPADSSAWLEKGGGDCNRRVVRGGSWNIYPRNLRSAFRLAGSTGGANGSLGFRIARAF